MKPTRKYPHFAHLSNMILLRKGANIQTPPTRRRVALQKVSADKFLIQRLTEHGGASLDNSTSSFKSLDLGTSITLTTTDNGTGVTHTTSGRSGNTGNESNNWLLLSVVLDDELSSLFLGRSTNFTIRC